MSEVSRRGVLAGGVATIAALATGCVSRQQPKDRARNDAVVIGISTAITTLDPMNTNTFATDLSVLSSVYNSLVERGPDLTLRPAVATTWRQVAPTRWRFSLDPRVTFSDGSRLDADVVVWNINRLLNPKNGLRQTANFSELSRAETINATTVDLITTRPSSTLPAALSFLYLLNPTWVTNHKPTSQTMGSGPYEIVSYSPGGNVELRARDNYWATRPAISNVTYQVTPSGSARVAGLLSGELDLVTEVEPNDLDQLRADRSLTVNQINTTRMAFIKLNAIRGPMRDVRIRRAANYAVDKEAITRGLLKGSVQPSPGQLVTADYAGYTNGLEAYPYDADRARALLAEAGYGPNRRLKVDLSVPAGKYVAGELVSQAVAQQLSQVGIDVSIHSQPFTVFMQKYLKEQAMPDLQYTTFSWPTLSADGLYNLFVSDSPYAYWNDETFTTAVKKATGAASNTERDAALATAARRARDEAPVIFLFPQPGLSAMSSGLQWRPRPDDWVRPADMSWSREGAS